MNENRCTGCGTPLGLDISEIEGIDVHELSCVVCKARHDITAREERKPAAWIHRFIVARLKR